MVNFEHIVISNKKIVNTYINLASQIEELSILKESVCWYTNVNIKKKFTNIGYFHITIIFTNLASAKCLVNNINLLIFSSMIVIKRLFFEHVFIHWFWTVSRCVRSYKTCWLTHAKIDICFAFFCLMPSNKPCMRLSFKWVYKNDIKMEIASVKTWQLELEINTLYFKISHKS